MGRGWISKSSSLTLDSLQYRAKLFCIQTNYGLAHPNPWAVVSQSFYFLWIDQALVLVLASQILHGRSHLLFLLSAVVIPGALCALNGSRWHCLTWLWGWAHGVRKTGVIVPIWVAKTQVTGIGVHPALSLALPSDASLISFHVLHFPWCGNSCHSHAICALGTKVTLMFYQRPRCLASCFFFFILFSLLCVKIRL